MEEKRVRNPDLGTAVEYRRTSLASLKVSILDKPHFKLENLLRRFIHESNPDDAGKLRCNHLKSSIIRLITTYSYSSSKVTQIASKSQVNPESNINKDQEIFLDNTKPLPLVGPRFNQKIPIKHFFNEDLEYLIHGNKEKKYVWSLIKSPAADYNLNWIEEYINRLFRSSVANYDKDSELGIHHWPELRKGFHEMRRASITKGDVHSNSKIKLIHDYPAYTICPNPYEVIYTYMHGGIRFMGINEVYKFGDGTIRFIYEELETMLKANTVGYIRGCLNGHAWIDRDIKRSRRMMKWIERILKARKKYDGSSEQELEEEDNVVAGEELVLGRPFVEVSNMTYDSSLGIVKFTNGTKEIAYMMPHRIEQFKSLSNMEKEHKQSVYFKSDQDKRRRVDYVMNKILGFYKECLELGPEYLIGLDGSRTVDGDT
ncbi:hypothetical protein Tco_0370894 [Tanacetum coccineum]